MVGKGGGWTPKAPDCLILQGKSDRCTSLKVCGRRVELTLCSLLLLLNFSFFPQTTTRED